jgi:hypothetical protein
MGKPAYSDEPPGGRPVVLDCSYEAARVPVNAAGEEYGQLSLAGSVSCASTGEPRAVPWVLAVVATPEDVRVPMTVPLSGRRTVD